MNHDEIAADNARADRLGMVLEWDPRHDKTGAVSARTRDAMTSSQ